MMKTRLNNKRNILAVTRSSVNSTASTSSSNTTSESRLSMRKRIIASFKKNDELSLNSETSSLGSKLQIPQAFLKNSSGKPAQVFPTSTRSSSSSREMLRQEAKVQRLVMQAKRAQEDSVLRQLHDPSEAQAMSMKLPAASYHSNKRSTMACLPVPFLKESKQVDSSALQTTSNGFRGKPWISSAANKFVQEEESRWRQLEAVADSKTARTNQDKAGESQTHECSVQERRRRGWKAFVPRLALVSSLRSARKVPSANHRAIAV